MKKITSILAAAIATFVMSTAQANSTEITPAVLKAFQTDFSLAENVHWSKGANHFKASCDYNGQHIYVYYNVEGKLKAITRYINIYQLPLQLQMTIKSSYPNFWVTELFEISADNSITYYITLENAAKKLVMKSDNMRDWVKHKEEDKE